MCKGKLFILLCNGNKKHFIEIIEKKEVEIKEAKLCSVAWKYIEKSKPYVCQKNWSIFTSKINSINNLYRYLKSEIKFINFSVVLAIFKLIYTDKL